MDALGINFQYLLIQCFSFLLLLFFSSLIAFVLLLVVRSFRPELFTSTLITLEAKTEGLLVPGEYIGPSQSYELRKFGKALMLIPRE
jgi:hypothetical protein